MYGTVIVVNAGRPVESAMGVAVTPVATPLVPVYEMVGRREVA